MLRLPGATAGKPGGGGTAADAGQTATTQARAPARRQESCSATG